jgi:DNA-directed RNA polymerase subunit L
MLRSDFDRHPLWQVFAKIDEQLKLIIGDHQPEEVSPVERIRTQMEYVRSFNVVASTRAAFFHPQMLLNVQSSWDAVFQSLAQRQANGIGYDSFTQQAADQAEAGLLQMAAWPRPYGKGGEVTQMNTLFEQLLEVQRVSVESLHAEHEALRTQVMNFSTEVDSKKDEVVANLDDIQTTLNKLDSVIEEQKSELASVIAGAETSVTNLSKQNSVAYEEWTTKQEKAFETDFDELRRGITDKLQSAHEEYELLVMAKEKYTKLVSAIAADEVASQFESEAKWGRRNGTWFYVLGFALLTAASVPLVWLIFDNPHTDSGVPNWTAITTRLGIGVLAGSAATVAIRLGSRLINNANAIKRMELELRAIGPFLANVSEKPKVDDAFIELIGKAFGNTYAETKSTGGSTDAQDERAAVTTTAQLIDLLDKVRKSAPPSA